MPEVPHNMQEDLQRMELEATDKELPRKDTSATASQTNQQTTQASPPRPTAGGFAPYLKEQQDDRGNKPATESTNFKPFTSGPISSTAMEAPPSFSPFPKVTGENIPPSDEEKEEILYQARDHVLHSNNVSMQVAWARDALMWVEVASEAQAREWTREKKSRGGERPATPKVAHELRVDAVNIIDYLAQQNHPEATFMKAKWQEFGKFGYRENKRDAYLGYKKAAEMGWGRAEYRMGMLYENSNDTEKAIQHYNQGVSMGDSAANYRLGMMFLMGQHGYPKDLQKGIDMVQKAAEGADEDAPQGAYVYGMLIARDLPDISLPEFLLPSDAGLARQYIEKAAYLGFSKAQLKMGQAYELSQLGCDFKPANSLHYYGLASHQGQPEAALGVSRWFLFGFDGAFSKNEQLAYKYAEEAAESGLATGEFAMGYYYEIGIHVPKDLRQARKWYELAAEHGNNDARDRIESLSQSKTLTKQDHETTTLTRIKSQHGSQRGKRPGRFAKQAEALPTLTESAQGSPTGTPRGPSPRASTQTSPGRRPRTAEETVDFPDPARRDNSGSKPPAFTVNFDNNPAMRPQSAAPYPVDDRPSPLNLGRPKSTAPYPEDDVVQKPPLSPHFNPSIRQSSGPQADRPVSAFGIRPLSQNLQPAQDYRGRVPPAGSAGGWEPQVPSGYRQPSPGAHGEYPYGQGAPPPQQQQQYAYDKPLPSHRLGAASVGPGVTVPAGAPVGDPTRNRLQKAPPNQNPNLRPQSAAPPGQFPMSGYGAQPAGAQPGRDYGQRTSSRPVSDNFGYGGGGGQGPPPQAGGRYASPAGSNPRPERLDSLGPSGDHGRLPSGRPPKSGQFDAPGRASAPPGAGGPGQKPVPGVPSSSSTTNLPGHGGRPSKSAHPDGKTIGNGPATFEEMGIPQGKNDSDCVSSSPCSDSDC